MKKKQYTAPQMSSYVLSSNEALLVSMSYEGNKVVTDGGKASEHGVTSADVKDNSYSVWDDDWSN